MLSIVIPVYNEQATIDTVVNRILSSQLAKRVSFEIVIVDDGSTDESWHKIEKLSQDSKIFCIRHKTNLGKGEAIRTAIRHVRGKITAIQDADLEYDPHDMELLFQHMACGLPAVYGSRYLQASWHGTPSNQFFRCGVAFLSACTLMLYGVRLSDPCTGHKMILTSVLHAATIQSRGFEFCAELTAKLIRMDVDILEVPISYAPRNRRQGKKLRWYDGFPFLLCLWHFRSWNNSLDRRT
jgi:glycosyltransferase involved in cell wall biosynthesis